MPERVEKHTDQEVISEVIGLLNEQREMKSILDAVAGLLHDNLRCHAIGIRVLDKLGNIPYISHKGFSKAFEAKEGPLCLQHDRCACIEITKGQYDSNVPLYTPHGSFYVNQLQDLDAHKEGMKSGRFRGECFREGWESLALVPIRFRHMYFGLIQVVYNETDRVPLERVTFIENVAGLLGVYMHGRESHEEKEREFSSLAHKIMHDLKSPLTSVKMFAELLAAKPGTDEVSDFAARITRNADYMDQLIIGLSSFLHEPGPEDEGMSKIDLNEFIPKVVSDTGITDKAGLAVKVSARLPEVTYSPVSLRRVLTNLIGNAAKYKANGKQPLIEIDCEEKDTFYQISVADNGTGIDRDEVEKVFYPFYRSHRVKDIPGAGLGLSICKKVVEKNGGKLWVYSDKGKGSTFYFTVPK